MLQNSFGFTFFLKASSKTNIRSVYIRITVDGVSKEKSTKQRWNAERWNQKAERATGTKEDARTLNLFLDSLSTKVNQFRIDCMNEGEVLTAHKLMDYLEGKTVSRVTVLEEFQKHNDEVLALVPSEYAMGTYERYVTAKSHIKNFIAFKYNMADITFKELNFEFVKDYEFYLKTIRNISNNTALKYIANFKKIVIRAIDKDIISVDPFKKFKGKKTKVLKRPLSSGELEQLENKNFSVGRLAVVRDIFVFQCYTGLAYIDVYNLKKSDIRMGFDGELWITSERQKTGSPINIPLLPRALEIINRYKEHELCVKRGSVLPVLSNQKMNAYLKEIADLCGIESTLNTHKARRTFGSTITLNNDVPINVVKEMLGHSSVKQTEEYALTEQRTIGKEMQGLKVKLSKHNYTLNSKDETITNLQIEIEEMKRIISQLQSSSCFKYK